MKSFFLLLFSAISFCSSHAQSWNLIWSDEFNYSGLPDSTKWGYEVGYIRNNELQYYTYKRLDNAIVTNGALRIIGKKEVYQGMNYTSASITTDGKHSWTYGKIEARMKLPMGKGMWPAFWMLGQNIGQVGWPKCGEIDIMEHINTENTIYGTPHWDNNGHKSNGGNTQSTPAQYHLYTVEWDSSSIKWFVDGNQYWTFSIANNVNGTEEFHKPFYIILNLAIGGSWPGSPDGTTKFPDTVFVDYVRVYKKSYAPDNLLCNDKVSPTVDGVEENAWASVDRDTLKSNVLGKVSSSSDLFATYKATWDSSALYFLVKVMDDSLKNDSGTASWDDDAVELFIDGNNEKATTYDSNDRQYIFKWNEPTVYSYFNSNTQPVNPAGVTFGQQNISGGYQMEIKVEWSAIGVTPSPGKLIGFDVHIDDDDNGGGRDSKIAWKATTDQSAQNPSTFGTLKLDSLSCGGPTGISGNSQTSGIAVYPNPVERGAGFFVSGVLAEEYEIRLYDLFGCLVREVRTVTGDRYRFDSGGLSAGVYMLVIQAGDERIVKKVALQ